MKRSSCYQKLCRPRVGRGAFMLFAFITALATTGFASAQSATTPTQEEAKAILMRTAEYMASLSAFSVNVRDSYDTYQKSGQKIEYGEVRKITIARPDRLRIEVEESDGARNIITFDGKELGITSTNPNVYAQIPKPGTIDNALVFFVRDLGMRLPFAALLITTAAAEIRQRTTRIDYVEKTSIFGAPAHHIAGRTDSVDYQIWIADGDKPLPLRLVLTYPKETGQPSFRAQFSDWNLAPQVTESTFALAPAPGAQKIAFLAELPRSAAPKAAKAAKAPAKNAGEKK